MDGDLARLAAEQGGFVFRWQALAGGCTEQEIAANLRHRKWVRVRRGAYARRDLVANLDATQRHVLILRAAVRNLSGPVVVTGYSALAVLGVPLWGVDLREVQVHRLGDQSSRNEAGVSHHRGPLAEEEIREIDGLLVAVPERAIVDACRGSSFEVGVVMADGVRRLPGFDIAAALETVERQRDWPFSVHASKALRFSDPRAETVGESRARVLLARIGVPKPDLQRRLVDSRTGAFLGVTDFYIDEYATVVEFDGKIKYGRALYERTGRVEDVDLGEVVWQEKRREDAIRDDGHEMTRLIWVDLEGHDHQVRARFDRTFARATARRIVS